MATSNQIGSGSGAHGAQSSDGDAFLGEVDVDRVVEQMLDIWLPGGNGVAALPVQPCPTAATNDSGPVLEATPKPKRKYTRRKVAGGPSSFSQPLPGAEVDENEIPWDSPEFLLPAVGGFLPPVPRKRQAPEGGSKATMPVRGGRGGKASQRLALLLENAPPPVIGGPALNAHVAPDAGLSAAQSNLGGTIDVNTIPLCALDSNVQRVVPPLFSSMKALARRKGKVVPGPVSHRPITRSMSTSRKVIVYVDSLQDPTHVIRPYPGAEYALGELVSEFFCTILKMDMVTVRLPGIREPQEFMRHVVHVMQPQAVLPKIDYSSCVCCLPEGETKLLSESESGDSNYDSTLPTPTLADIALEEDKAWDDVVPEDPTLLPMSEEYFRYFDHLPFEKKYHDVHWLREYTSCFGSERAWFGKDEVGIPHLEKTRNPMDILMKFITVDTWDRIVHQTNLYAQQKQRKDWTTLTVPEFKCWLGICVYMGILKLPQLDMHWKRDHPLFRNDYISSLMRRDRWLDVMACVHLVDNTTITSNKQDPAYDKIGKVRWLLDEVCSRFREFKAVDRFLSVDEMMVACTSKFCPIKQYNKDKPDPHGIKVWALVSASSKYIYALDVFCGAQSGPGQVPAARAPANQPLEDRATYKVVWKLMEHVPSKLGHVVTMDNYFTSVKLFVDLLERGIYATGTARPGMIGWPASMLWSKRQKGSRGQLSWRMHASLEIGASVWFDKKPVAILSSFALPWKANTFVSRKEGGSKVDVPTCPALLSYVKLMRGVDVADQLRAGYSISRKGKRWWKRPFFFIFDSAFCNSYVVAQQMWEGTPREEHPFFTHVQYNIALGDALVSDWVREKNIQVNYDEAFCGRTAHGPVWESSKRRKCRVCGMRTRWHCAVCSDTPFLCMSRTKHCYQLFHQTHRLTM